MAAWVRRRLCADAGLSLVEMLVAVLILGVVLSAFASTVITSLAAIVSDERRVHATQLANEVLEDLRGLDWDLVGFYSDDFPAGAPDFTDPDSGDAHELVILDDTRDGDTLAPVPAAQTLERDGVEYEVTLTVYWLDEGDDEDQARRKGLHALVAWDHKGQAHTFQSRSARAPSAEEVPLAESEEHEESFGVTIAPSLVEIGPSGQTLSDVNVLVQTSPPPDVPPQLAWSGPTTGLDTLTAVEGEEQRLWATTLAAGTSTFENGTYEFTATAQVAGETLTAVQQVTFITPSEVPVEIATPQLDPEPPLCVENNGTLIDSTEVRFEVRGVYENGEATVEWTSQNRTVEAQLEELTDDGAVFVAEIEQGHKFNSGVTNLTITASRPAIDDTTASETFTYQVGC